MFACVYMHRKVWNECFYTYMMFVYIYTYILMGLYITNKMNITRKGG